MLQVEVDGDLDRVSEVPVRRGLGFELGGLSDPRRQWPGATSTARTFWHGGFSSSVCWGDRESGLSMALLTNGVRRDEEGAIARRDLSDAVRALAWSPAAADARWVIALVPTPNTPENPGLPGPGVDHTHCHACRKTQDYRYVPCVAKLRRQNTYFVQVTFRQRAAHHAPVRVLRSPVAPDSRLARPCSHAHGRLESHP